MLLRTLFLGLIGLSLGACDSTSGSIHEGAQARFSVTAVGANSDEHSSAESDQHSKHSSSYVTFRNAEGVRIDLQVGQVNLVPVELKPCVTLASWFESIGQGLIGSAWAHSGAHEDDEPTAVLDALSDEAKFIGSLALEVGDYCGIMLAVEPISAASGASDNGSELTGHAVDVYPCYFHNTAHLSDEEYAAGGYDTSHSCVQFQAGSALSTLELDFSQAVTISAERHHLDIGLAAHVDTWFDGVAMDDVASDAGEQAKMLSNIRNSIYIDTLELD